MTTYKMIDDDIQVPDIKVPWINHMKGWINDKKEVLYALELMLLSMKFSILQSWFFNLSMKTEHTPLTIISYHHFQNLL
jgi:hypothetical protein